MIETPVLPAVPGVAELLGAGVHVGVPAELPAAIRGRDVVALGSDPAAVLRLADWCRTVTVVTKRPCRGLDRALRARPNVTVLCASELVCVDGIGSVEAVVVRRMATGRLTGVNAAALFIDITTSLDEKGRTS